MAKINYQENPMMQINKIDYITLYPNVEDVNVNTCLMVCRDQHDNTFLMYCPRVSKEINLSVLEKEAQEWFRTISLEREYEFKLKLLPSDEEQVIFKVFMLEEKAKDMTQLEIEKELGYKINIVK